MSWPHAHLGMTSHELLATSILSCLLESILRVRLFVRSLQPVASNAFSLSVNGPGYISTEFTRCSCIEGCVHIMTRAPFRRCCIRQSKIMSKSFRLLRAASGHRLDHKTRVHLSKPRALWSAFPEPALREAVQEWPELASSSEVFDFHRAKPLDGQSQECTQSEVRSANRECSLRLAPWCHLLALKESPDMADAC